MAKKNVATEKKVIPVKSRMEYKALCDAIDECQMHHYFGETTIGFTRIDKARKVIVEYIPCFGMWADELQLICTALEFLEERKAA